MKTKLGLLSAVVAASALSAQAELIDVNFYSSFYGGSPASGPAVIGSSGDMWNGFNADGGGGAGSLVDSTGNPTSASLTFAADGAVHSLAPNIQPNPSLMYDYAFSLGAPITVSITGLAPSTTYDLYVYLASNDGGGGLRTVGVDANGAAGGASGNPETSFIDGENYLLLTPETTASGDLIISESPTLLEADMNGFQLSTIPAGVPDQASTLWLLGLGVMGMLIAHRISARGPALAARRA